ncbi:reverse transcriptase domain-containing protein [Tanacetum coccineum]
MEKILKRYGVHHRFATAYHPQTTGQVENTNRALKRILKKTVKDNPSFWSKKLVDALWAFHSLNDEEDTRSSKEYMNDLELEFHERALLAQSKRFFKKDEEEVSLDDNEIVEVKVLMALVVDESSVAGKESVRNGDRVKISIIKESFVLFHWDKFTNVCGSMACIGSGACNIRALKRKDMEMEG